MCVVCVLFVLYEFKCLQTNVVHNIEDGAAPQRRREPAAPAGGGGRGVRRWDAKAKAHVSRTHKRLPAAGKGRDRMDRDVDTIITTSVTTITTITTITIIITNNNKKKKNKKKTNEKEWTIIWIW